MNPRPYQVCTKTIMDTTDPNIIFNEKGESDYYTNFITNILPDWNHGEGKLEHLLAFADKVKKFGKGKDYDCIIGLSGGLDSSFCVYVTTQIMGLRPLLYHVDAGWNTEVATSNIQNISSKLNLDLHTDTINWAEMKDLQRAFLKSQIADQDTPQDAAFFSSLYKFAKKNKIKYVFTGANYSTECCREPYEWGAYPGIDTRLIKDIYKKFGNGILKTFPLIDIFYYKIFYQKISGMQVFHPLNHIVYIKEEAEKILTDNYNWKPFLHKHHESRFTRFFEDYWLPKKFGFHKRRAHFSSLILTGQMTRDDALERISEPELSDEFLKNEFEFIADKLDFSVSELQMLFQGENKSYKDYKNKMGIIKLGAQAMQKLGLEKRLFR